MTWITVQGVERKGKVKLLRSLPRLEEPVPVLAVPTRDPAWRDGPAWRFGQPA